MIWHIFKKDLRLLWPIALVVAAVQFVNAALLCSGGQFERATIAYTHLGWVSNDALPAVSLFGLVILVIAVLQQDRFPGTTQDWLTRPVMRSRLLGAKLLFIMLVGLVPIMLSDVAMGIAAHLRTTDVVAASLTRAACLFGFVCLPAILVGMVTRSLTDAMLLTVAVVVVLVLELIGFSQRRMQLPLLDSGYAWTVTLGLLLANMVAALVMVPLQLRWRSTNRVKWIAIAYLCVAPAVVFLPWGVGFGLQRALDGPTDPSLSVQVDPDREISFTAPRSGITPDVVETVYSQRDLLDTRFATLTVPVAQAASQQDEAWIVDYGRATVLDPATGLPMSSTDQSVFGLGYLGDKPGKPSVYVQMSGALFVKARAHHAVVRATLFLTALHRVTRQPVTMLDGGSIDDFSRCGFGSRPALRCVSTRPVGTCYRYIYPEVEHRDPLRGFSCMKANYVPWPMPFWRDPYYTTEIMNGFGTDALVLLNYVPATHFVRVIEFELDKAVDKTYGASQSVDGIGQAARFANPGAMVIDSHGTLFVVDGKDSVIRKVTTTGEVTTYAGRAGHIGKSDGQGHEVLFNHPQGIAVDLADNLYVADTGNAVIRKISPTGIVSTIAGASPTASSGGVLLTAPTHVVLARDGTIYVIDRNGSGDSVLRKVAPNGTVSAVAGPEGGN